MLTFALLRDSSDLHIYKDLFGHRRPKLTIRGVILCFFFTLLYERSAKRDMGHILYYLTIELDHAKRDSGLAAYGGVQRQSLSFSSGNPPNDNSPKSR